MNDCSYTPYFVVGPQRSGTTVTHHCLRGHPHVSALREELAFAPFFTEGMAAFTFGRPGTDAEQEQGRRLLFDAMTAAGRDEATRACGVKCAFGHGDQARHFTEVIRKEFPEAKIVHVVRNDQVAQFGSRLKARSTRVFHQTNGSPAPEAPQLTLDLYRFVEHMLAMHETHTHLRRLHDAHDVLTIDYENDILNGDLRTHEALFSFVGVDPVEVTWLRHKKVSPPPETYITNYAELRELQHTIEARLDAGASFDDVREAYAPPPLKALYRRAREWVEHPGYTAYRVGKGLKTMFGSSNSDTPK